MILRHKQVACRLRGESRVWVRQKKASETPSERSFANSGRPADNEGMCQTSSQIGPKKLLFRLCMAKQTIGLARMRRVLETVRLRPRFRQNLRCRLSHCQPAWPPPEQATFSK